MRRRHERRHFNLAHRSLLGAAAALFAAPASAQPPSTCGNGYCDGWAGETPITCPVDCATRANVPLPAEARPLYPAPGAYGPPGTVLSPEAMAQLDLRGWSDGDPVPPGFHVESKPIKGLIVGGAVTLGVAYILDLAIGLGQTGSNGGFTVIPVFGPFIAGALYRPAVANCSPGIGCAIGNGLSNLDTGLYRGFLYTFGVMQILGAAMLIPGVVVHRPHLTSNSAFTLRPVPVTGRNGGGLGVAGTF